MDRRYNIMSQVARLADVSGIAADVRKSVLFRPHGMTEADVDRLLRHTQGWNGANLSNACVTWRKGAVGLATGSNALRRKAQFAIGGKPYDVSRLLFSMFVEPLPRGDRRRIYAKCKNTCCVNPFHMELRSPTNPKKPLPFGDAGCESSVASTPALSPRFESEDEAPTTPRAAVPAEVPKLFGWNGWSQQSAAPVPEIDSDNPPGVYRRIDATTHQPGDALPWKGLADPGSYVKRHGAPLVYYAGKRQKIEN